MIMMMVRVRSNSVKEEGMITVKSRVIVSRLKALIAQYGFFTVFGRNEQQYHDQ